MRILEDISASLDLDSVLSRVVDQIARVVPADRVSILLLNREGRSATVVACTEGVKPGTIQIDLERYPEIRKALRERKRVVVEDLLQSDLLEPVRESLRHIGFNSVMVIPLIFGSEALGSLVLKAASYQMKFEPDQVRFCQAAATAAANALKNSVLHHEAKEAAACHRATAVELQNILDHSPDLIVTSDDQGRIERWNRGAELVLGTLAEEARGRGLADFYPRWREGDTAEGLTSKGYWVDHEAVLRHAEGHPVQADLTVVPLQDDDGGFLLVGRDVTELNASRRALQHADRLTGLGEVISGVAHGLKNPLAGVLGHAQLLESLEGLGEPALGHVRSIVENARRCRRVVRNLLGFARTHEPQETLASITQVLDTVLDLCSYQLKTQNIRVERDYADDLPATFMDAHRMEHVFVNLVQNAVHALARQEGPGTIEVRARLQAGELIVVVADDGPGVSPDTQERIFEPFFTTKGEGTGLGLSIAAAIVAEQGGSMAYHPVPGGGASFRVRLPVRSEPIERGEEPEQGLPVAGTGSAA
jgi:PAS domain S-box-containing protein